MKSNKVAYYAYVMVNQHAENAIGLFEFSWDIGRERSSITKSRRGAMIQSFLSFIKKYIGILLLKSEPG